MWLTTHSKIIWAAVLCETTNNLTYITISQIYFLNQKAAQRSECYIECYNISTDKIRSVAEKRNTAPVSRWMLPCFTDKAYLYIKDTDIALWFLVCNILWSFLCCFSCRFLLHFLFLPRGFVVPQILLIFRSLSLKSTEKGNHIVIKKKGQFVQDSSHNKWCLNLKSANAIKKTLNDWHVIN